MKLLKNLVIGNQNSEFVDNLVIQLPKYYSFEKINQYKDKIKLLFNNCVHLFQPYCGEDVLRNTPVIKPVSFFLYYPEPIGKCWFIQLKSESLDDTLEEEIKL